MKSISIRWNAVCLTLLFAPIQASFAQQSSTTSHTAEVGDKNLKKNNLGNYDIVEVINPADKPDAWHPPVTLQLQGEVKQFDGERLALLESDGSPRTIPSQYVLRIEPQWRNESAAAAHQLFVERKYQAVVKAVPQALQDNLAQWQQRLLIAELVQSATALGNPRVAGNYFLSLAKSNPPHLLYADMPLCWTVSEPDQALREESQKWLLEEAESARLLGASWLLFGEQSSEAKQALSQLQTSQNSAIANMAALQGWRLVPPPQTMSALPGWLEFRDQLLPPLQIGPTEFIADRLMRIGQPDLAIGQWLRIASQHGDRPHRAAQALQSAATQLQRLERNEEAQRLMEWIDRLTPGK